MPHVPHRSDEAPTLEKVARLAGVSRATASRVVNDVATVTPELRAAVQKVVEEIGYAPNGAARSLVTRRTDTVALIVSEPDHGVGDQPFLTRLFTDPYVGRVTAGAQEALRPRGIHLVIMPADPPAHPQVLRYLQQQHVDGVILISSRADDPLPAVLGRVALPVVISRDPSPVEGLGFVDMDQRAGGALAAQHLADRGRRRLATIAGPQDMPAARDRLQGFLDAAASLGLHPPAVVEGDFTRAGGSRATLDLLGTAPDVDGIFAANDLMADGALGALREHGRDVPGDVAVVGFDDSSVAAHTYPPLTTVRQPVEEMARGMADLLLARLDGTASPSVDAPVYAPSLVVRAST